jgi:hypothetical protein
MGFPFLSQALYVEVLRAIRHKGLDWRGIARVDKVNNGSSITSQSKL